VGDYIPLRIQYSNKSTDKTSSEIFKITITSENKKSNKKSNIKLISIFNKNNTPYFKNKVLVKLKKQANQYEVAYNYTNSIYNKSIFQEQYNRYIQKYIYNPMINDISYKTNLKYESISYQVKIDDTNNIGIGFNKDFIPSSENKKYLIVNNNETISLSQQPQTIMNQSTSDILEMGNNIINKTESNIRYRLYLSDSGNLQIQKLTDNSKNKSLLSTTWNYYRTILAIDGEYNEKHKKIDNDPELPSNKIIPSYDYYLLKGNNSNPHDLSKYNNINAVFHNVMGENMTLTTQDIYDNTDNTILHLISDNCKFKACYIDNQLSIEYGNIYKKSDIITKLCIVNAPPYHTMNDNMYYYNYNSLVVNPQDKDRDKYGNPYYRIINTTTLTSTDYEQPLNPNYVPVINDINESQEKNDTATCIKICNANSDCKGYVSYKKKDIDKTFCLLQNKNNHIFFKDKDTETNLSDTKIYKKKYNNSIPGLSFTSLPSENNNEINGIKNKKMVSKDMIKPENLKLYQNIKDQYDTKTKGPHDPHNVNTELFSNYTPEWFDEYNYQSDNLDITSIMSSILLILFAISLSSYKPTAM